MKEKFVLNVKRPIERTMGVKLEKETYEAIDSLAKENGVTRSEVVRQMVQYALAHLDTGGEA